MKKNMSEFHRPVTSLIYKILILTDLHVRGSSFTSQLSSYELIVGLWYYLKPKIKSNSNTKIKNI